MQLSRQFCRYLSTRKGLTAFSLVLTTCLLCAFFTGRTFFLRLPEQYHLDFGPAKWIQVAGAEPSRPAYFRKTIYAGSAVEYAWLQIAATGYYKLYVNNIVVDENSYPGVRTTGAYDLTSLLAKGKNVIAVKLAAGNFPGPNQLRVRGVYSLASSPGQEFYSDSSWRVSEVATSIVGSYPWTSAYLDDSAWSHATEGYVHELLSTVQPVAFDPAVIEEPPAARWIAPRENEVDAASFAYTFEIPFARGETWLRIAANGGYDLVVNGWLVATQAHSPRATRQSAMTPVLDSLQIAHSVTDVPAVVVADSGLPGSRTPAAVPPSTSRLESPALVSSTEKAASASATQPEAVTSHESLAAITPLSVPPAIERIPHGFSLQSALGSPLLLAYNISPWLRTGKNTIVIRERSDLGPPLLLADGHTRLAASTTQRFATGESWRVAPLGRERPVHATNASIVSDYLSQPGESLPRAIATPPSTPSEDLYFVTRWAAVVGIVILSLVGLWFLTPVLTFRSGQRAVRIWTYDALLHLPVCTLLLALLLLSCDIRFPSNGFFTRGVILTVFAWLLGSIVVSTQMASAPASRLPVVRRHTSSGDKVRWWPAVLGVIVATGFIVRAVGLLDASFGHDEAAMARFSTGILKCGLPYIDYGVYKRFLTTYELVPYPMALSSLLFGHTVFAYRLPALIFGSLTVGAVGLAAYRIFDWRTGIASALVYAFLPSPIQWARDGFYPSQDCFFAVLTFWLFYEAVRSEKQLHRGYLALSSVTFLLTYFSWEGSGFILPTLFALLIVMRWGRFDWIRDRYLWLLVTLTSALVILQLCGRQLLLPPDYLGVAYDLSEVSTPAPVFLNRAMFEPFYYVSGFLLAENHTVLTILAICGVLLGRSHRGLRYVSLSLFMLEFWYTFFLPKYGPRYTFNALPLLDLAAVGCFFVVVDRINELGSVVRVRPALLIQSGCLGVLLMGLCISANGYLPKLYRLGADPTEPSYFERAGVEFKANYRDADLYVSRHLRPGDIVMTREPHVFAFYTGKAPQYSTDTLWNSRVFYDGLHQPPRYIDKWYNLPSLNSLKDILDVRMASGRIWIIKSTGCRREFDFQDKTFLELWGRPEFETNCEEVVSLTGLSSQRIKESDPSTKRFISTF